MFAEAPYVLVPILEHVAAAIAAGAVLGTFTGASKGFLASRSRKQVEADALREGYLGAVVAVGCLLLDLWNVYATSI
jgi:hypothetical protein